MNCFQLQMASSQLDSYEKLASRGWLFVVIGFMSFMGFVFVPVVSNILPLSDNSVIAAIQSDRYYCFLVPLTLPILVIAVYFRWLSMKLFKHA
ncbi:hypothetical protein Tsubulata_001002 [Turnera subulata]|uniref:Uncharacterized protein n=1 Tax=Turnera subulata TaxID=218843 RepID=A0A9Q0FDF6_9ROSI|nr:hypothetical protein Tsubulata_001002 [Turnera subulata]